MITLQKKITKELANIERVVSRVGQTLDLIQSNEDEVYLDNLIDSLTLYQGNFYMGIERIFLAIAKEIDRITPSGDSWHIQLLKQMTVEIASVRPAVISQETYERLNEFRGFRHVARSLYAYDLDAERVIKLANEVTDCFDRFQSDLQSFLGNL